MNRDNIDTREVLAAYFKETPSYCAPYGNGHINDTFLVVVGKRYIMQRMNTAIFTKPVELMAQGDERAALIYETIGAYFGYAVAYYALFYDIKHVLLMGRVSSGKGGEILFENAKRVLAEEFPELAKKITIHLPDESSRRVGQSIAAASLPSITK